MNHYLVVLLVLGTPHAVAGQAEEAIVRCAKLTSEQARIECLENALRGGDPAPAGDVGAPVSEADERTTGSEASTQPAAVPASPPAATGDADAPAAAVAAPAAVSRDAGPSSAPAAETDAAHFGLPPEKTEAARPDEIAVNVTAVSQNAYGKLIFTTEAGQVWVQTDQSRRRFRDVPFEAEIRAGASGSFFLRQATGGPSVRVRRQK
jgi:hypothetical protein